MLGAIYQARVIASTLRAVESLLARRGPVRNGWRGRRPRLHPSPARSPPPGRTLGPVAPVTTGTASLTGQAIASAASPVGISADDHRFQEPLPS